MAATSTSTAELLHSKNPKYSCIRCFERKVKCNKQKPCSACVRSRVECVPRVPAPPRRRRKRGQEEVLLARLSRYENLLKTHGLSPDDATESVEALRIDESDGKSEGTHDADAESHSSPDLSRNVSLSADIDRLDAGKLYIDGGNTTFLESSLWNSLSDELPKANDAIGDSSGEEESEARVEDPFRLDLVLGYTPAPISTRVLHPSPDHIFKLWQIFLDNVNPLTKIIHHPTVQNELLQAAFNLERVPKNFETLMFAIYSIALTSINDSECQRTFGGERKALLARYSLGMRKALMRVKFLGTSDMVVLQAFMLYLFAMRPFYRSRTIWVLAGVASRIAQGMGLHRDGAALGLPVFESEMRRRLWWQVAILDGRSAELTGSSNSAMGILSSDIKVPLNVNDSELYPGMTEPPKEHVKATEMTGCLLRYEMGSYHRLKKEGVASRGWGSISASNSTFSQTDKLVDDYEKILEDKFLRYLDPSIPVHFFTSIVGRVSVCMMRLMAHHPRHQNSKPGTPSQLDPSEKTLLFNTSLKIIECDNICHSTKSAQRFLWHMQVYFQWHALIYLLTDLRTRTKGDDADRAWQQIEEVFEHHPDFVTETRRAIHVAIGNLCLKAWNARERALAQHTGPYSNPSPPQFIQRLRARNVKTLHDRVSASDKVSKAEAAPETDHKREPGPLMQVQSDPGDEDFDMGSSFDPAYYSADISMEDTPGQIDWSQWDYLLQDFEVPHEST